ncbi:MAG: xylulokinase [Geminicoccaceae bacterium]
MSFLGLDVGTSAVKAVLVDGDQRLLAEAEAPLATSRPRPLWSEQDPDDWWTATLGVVAGLRQAEPKAYGAVRAIGLSGQMHGAVVLDADDRPLRPAILWNDGRAQAECRLLSERVPEIGRIAGVPPTPGYTAPKLLWLAAHEPELFARVVKVLPPKDYVRLRLTGDHATDPVDAAGTLWLDEARRAWSPEILAATGLSEKQMPCVVEGNEPAGALRTEVAVELGLPAGTPVAAGAGDAAAGAIGIGAIADGDAFVSLGTSAQYFVTTASYRPCPERLIQAYCHGLPERWYQCAALLNGASCLGWAAALLGEADIPALVARVEARWRGPSRVLFLPYLMGERTPHDDPYARGVLFGLEPDTDAVEVAQAVMEGVAFSLAEAQDCLSVAGSEVEVLAAIGGGARSPFWMRLLATVLDRPVTVYAGAAKGPAFGAARLARLALTAEAPEAVCGKPEIAQVLEPERPLVDSYFERGRRFRYLYQALRSEFRAGECA